jgi:hypothetical protein
MPGNNLQQGYDPCREGTDKQPSMTTLDDTMVRSANSITSNIGMTSFHDSAFSVHVQDVMLLAALVVMSDTCIRAACKACSVRAALCVIKQHPA